jgi:hypothetical protein
MLSSIGAYSLAVVLLSNPDSSMVPNSLEGSMLFYFLRTDYPHQFFIDLIIVNYYQTIMLLLIKFYDIIEFEHTKPVYAQSVLPWQTHAGAF